MREALKQAQYALSEDEVPIGTVVVHKDRIISRGYNQVERLKDVTAHAEMIAITSASEHIGGKFLQECSIFITLEPCVMCIGAIRLARFKRVVFGAQDQRHILPGRWEQLLSHVDVKGGVLEKECQKLLIDFFQNKRGNIT